jgi:hypothetical protein
VLAPGFCGSWWFPEPGVIRKLKSSIISI